VIEYNDILHVWERLKSIEGYSGRPVYIDLRVVPNVLRVGHAQLRPGFKVKIVGYYDAFTDLQDLVEDVRSVEAENAN